MRVGNRELKLDIVSQMKKRGKHGDKQASKQADTALIRCTIQRTWALKARGGEGDITRIDKTYPRLLGKKGLRKMEEEIICKMSQYHVHYLHGGRCSSLLRDPVTLSRPLCGLGKGNKLIRRLPEWPNAVPGRSGLAALRLL